MVVSGASDTATVIEVGDRPSGLLQDIGITLARASLAVRSAHIATYAGQTLDTFYVTEFGGGRLAPARAAQAVAMIIDTCDGPTQYGRSGASVRREASSAAYGLGMGPSRIGSARQRLKLPGVRNPVRPADRHLQEPSRQGPPLESDVNKAIRDIRLALLDADVALPVVKRFTTRSASGRSAKRNQALNPAQQVVKIVNEELVASSAARRARSGSRRPSDGHHARRPAGFRQDDVRGQVRRRLREAATHRCSSQPTSSVRTPSPALRSSVSAGLKVFAPERGNIGGHDAVAGTGRDARSATRSRCRVPVSSMRAQQHDVVIVDTAGRLAVDANLMQQAADIREAIQPDEVLFVIDAMIGQAAVETAQAFHEGVAFTGVVLSKLDGDARGGAALSIREVTGEPIMFASVGEKVTDIEVFHPDRMAGRILDMGDVLTLIEQAEKAFDKRQADEMARKFLAEEDFTFEDFLQQMNAIKKMGSLKSMLGDDARHAADAGPADSFDDREFDRVEAMVRSMTRSSAPTRSRSTGRDGPASPRVPASP